MTFPCRCSGTPLPGEALPELQSLPSNATMSWQLRGEYLENCNCDILCPCLTSSLQGPADNERCYVPLAMHISEGHSDGVRLDGLNAVLVVEGLHAQDSPAVMEIVNVFHPMGSNLPIARSVTGRYHDPDYGLSFDNTGKNGHFRE